MKDKNTVELLSILTNPQDTNYKAALAELYKRIVPDSDPQVELRGWIRATNK